MADNQEQRTKHKHRSRFPFIVHIVAENGRDAHCKKREHRKDGGSRLAHIPHRAISYKGDDRNHKRRNLDRFVLGKAESECTTCNDEHNHILDIRGCIARPKRTYRTRVKREVALKHIDRIFLERENSRVIKHAKQRHHPEAKRTENLSEIGNLERIVLFLSLSRLRIKLLVHKEINDKHNQGHHQEHHSESH